MEMEQTMDDSMQQQQKLKIFSKQQLSVNLKLKVSCNDFVYVKIDESGKCRVAKIQELYGKNKALVVWYLRPDELPKGIELYSETGLEIKFNKGELIENSFKSENIDLESVVSKKCTVIKARENETVKTNENSMAYICRYKLIKQTYYKLVPVDWQPGEEEACYSDDMNDDEEPSEGHNENVMSLNESLDLLEKSLKSMENLEINEKTVSPIKIKNNRVIRSRDSTKKRSSPDTNKDNNEVSPSKRIRATDNINNAFDSPGGRNSRYESPSEKRMSLVKKDLNKSFTTEPLSNVEDSPRSPYHITAYDIEKPLRMQLTKNRVLRERNEGENSTPVSFSTLKESIPATRQRRSILKGPDSAKNTPKQKVGFTGQLKESKRTIVESTPRRQSQRISSHDASAKLSAAAEDSSPEIEKRSTRKSTSKRPASPPATPKSTSKRTIVPRTPKTPKTPKSVMTPQQTKSLYRSGNLTPSIQSREKSISMEQTELEMVRDRLQVSAVPKSLPCREKEFSSIYEFITGKLDDGTGGCIYISGVPGTGKTATVTQVIKKIQSEMKPRKWPAFDYVDINGMRLTEPRQAYVQIYRQLTGKTMAWAQARDLLEARFTGTKKSSRSTILLVDELDIICNRKQDVVYNLFDWTARKGSRLVAITIANTMDLPERVLKLKVASRLGLTRITFTPYSFKQLQEVVMARLAGSKCFMADAVQLVARKVASVSGDCRRALDICRRATEIAEEKSHGTDHITVSFVHINQALSEMFASPKVRAIKNCTKFQKLFLQAVASEITRTGIEEVEFCRVYQQIQILAPILGIKTPPTEDQSMLICMALSANRLLIAEDSSAGLYQKIILNATVDDLYYALNIS